MTRLATLALRGLVAVWRYGLSPFTPACCRFLPSCSAYAEEALARHGPARGLALTARRLARCQPLGGHGFDPVPEAGGGPEARDSSWRLPRKREATLSWRLPRKREATLSWRLPRKREAPGAPPERAG